jgi:hypothetical protein
MQLWLVLALFCMSGWLSGCAMMAEEIAAHGIFKGRDKTATSAAMDRRKDKYPYIEFDQQFPETYLFKEHQHKVWNNILTLLDRRGEIILSKDKNKGLIVTDAKNNSKVKGYKKNVCDKPC